MGSTTGFDLRVVATRGFAALLAAVSIACAKRPPASASGEPPAHAVAPPPVPAPPVASSSPAARVGVFDLQLALASSAAGQAARRRVDALVQERLTSLRSLAAQLERDDAGTARGNADSLAQLERAQQQSQLRRAQEAAREDTELLARELTGAIEAQLAGIISQIARERGLALVIQRSLGGLYYHDPAIEITRAVVERLDALPPVGGASPLAD